MWTPGRGQFSPQGHNLNNFGRGPLNKKIFENCILKTFLFTPWPTYVTNWNGLNNSGWGSNWDQSCEVWSTSNECPKCTSHNTKRTSRLVSCRRFQRSGSCFIWMEKLRLRSFGIGRVRGLYNLNFTRVIKLLVENWVLLNMYTGRKRPHHKP